jgi:hypothetical protein
MSANGTKRTSLKRWPMSANDPKRTSLESQFLEMAAIVGDRFDAYQSLALKLSER